MQVFDESDNVISSGVFDSLEETQKAAVKALRDSTAKRAKIVKLPANGDITDFCGLRVKVLFIDQQKKTIRLKIL